MKEFTYTIKDELGIHARPAGLLVKAAKACTSKICIKMGDKTSEATKLMAIMSMGVKNGNTVTVTAEGDNEDTDIETMKAFFEENL